MNWSSKSLALAIIMAGALGAQTNTAYAQQKPTLRQMIDQQQQGVAPPMAASRAVTTTEGPVVSARRSEFRTARQVRTTVDWASAKSAVKTFDTSGRKPSRMLTLQAPAAPTTINLPLLVPENVPANMRVIGKDYWFHATCEYDGYGLSIHGTTVLSEVRSPGDQETASSGLQLFQTEDGMAASFSLFGAAYSVNMICDNPQGDARCRSEAFMNNIIDALVVQLGGVE